VYHLQQVQNKNKFKFQKASNWRYPAISEFYTHECSTSIYNKLNLTNNYKIRDEEKLNFYRRTRPGVITISSSWSSMHFQVAHPIHTRFIALAWRNKSARYYVIKQINLMILKSYNNLIKNTSLETIRYCC
jgi:hypothetical protein